MALAIVLWFRSRVKGLLMSLVVASWACGPGIALPEAPTANEVLVDSTSSAAGIEALLHESVTNGGLLFPSADCAQFSTGEIKKDRFAEFARCLKGLGLTASGRDDAFPDVAVMKYGPGYEVEARLIRDGAYKQLSWIGFASRHDGNDVPTLGREAFEKLRVSGQVNGKLDAEVTRVLESELDASNPKDVAQTWLKVCLDETGAVTSLFPHESSSAKAEEVFVGVVKGWTFRPFVVEGQPVPVCSMVRMVHPLAKADPVEKLPLPPPPSRGKRALLLSERGFAKLTEGKRIAGTWRIVPDDGTKARIQRAMAARRERSIRVTGTFRLCVNESGRVESVLPIVLTGYAAYDRDIMEGMRKWVYAPYKVNDQPVPVCTAITFVYSQR